MTLVDRRYPDIVGDVLTNLTGGVSAEIVPVPPYDPNARPVQVPDLTLQRRPVQRVSLVTGFVSQPGEEELAPYTFTLNDYELVTATDDPTSVPTIRFLPFGRRPAPGSELRVSYYPRESSPSPITDIGVGSVARTLVEAIGKELGVVYAQLNQAYDSAFVETATGSSLDRVVALLGIERYRALRPIGRVRFSRRAGSPGTITIPVGTPVTDAADTIRYETVDSHTMFPSESSAEVRVRGAADDTPVVEARVLTVVQRSVAGIDAVVNDQATARGTQDETDVELRVRARAALVASNKGTVEAIVDGLLQLPDVRAVAAEEFPNGVPGEIRLSISLADATRTELPASVRARIEELRPAGVRVLQQLAGSTLLQARVALVLAGSHRPDSEIEQIHEGVRSKLVDLVGRAGVGQRIRTGPLVAALLADERIVDATIALGERGVAPGEPGADFVPVADAAVELAPADTAFEPDVFEQPLEGPPLVTVEVRASIAVVGEGDVPAATEAQLSSRLSAYFGELKPSAVVDAPTLLTALRNDAAYALDPLRLQVTLVLGDQFVVVAQGGPAFTVLEGQRFSVVSVEVST